MKKLIILTCCLLFVLPASSQTYKVLFDHTKNEDAGNADWIIDTSEPIPTPAQSTITASTAENYWLGAISAWGICLAKRGWTVATLTTANGISYGNASNPYDLSNYDLYIVCEPQGQFSVAEKAAIKAFVQNGGGLMMVADHDGSDRNSDGWDSPKVWNDLRTDSLFGIHFQSTGETNNNISQVATNVKGGGDPLITGVGLSSAVSNISFHNGTTITVLPSVNPNATGHIWMNSAAQGNSQIMFATSKYGAGRVAGVGDSSPADDGSAQPGNSSIFNGWGETGATDSSVFMNACLWLVQHDVTVTKFTITSSAGINGTISPVGTVQVDSAASQAFTITANSGYQIDSVLVDGVNQGTVSSYTFTNVTAAHTIRAVFKVTQYQITASAGTNGTISPTGAVLVNSGASQLFTFTPATGYHVDSVIVDGVKQVTSPTTYTFTNVTATHTIRVSFAINTYTITASVTGNGTISPSGVVSVNYGANQTFTITAGALATISNVVVDGSSVGAVGTYTFTGVTANHTIAVTFVGTTFTITASAGTGGSISPTGAVPVTSGSSQLFTFTPSTGYHVDSVIVDGAKLGNSPTTYTFTNVTAAHSIRVTFALNTYTITASATGNGTISPAGLVSVTYGNNQIFTITAGALATISDVLVDGGSVGPVGTYTFTGVSANHTIAVTFTGSSYTITSSAGTGGSISPLGAVNVSSGQSQSFTITPATGYSIASVLVDGSTVGAVSTYNFTNVAANHTISASFSPITFTIAASAASGGTISPSGSVVVTYGQSQSFTISPSPGHGIADVLVDGSSVGPVTSYSFTNVTAAHTIAALFFTNGYVINAAAGSGGSISPSGAVGALSGANVPFTITADAGHYIDSLLVDNANVSAASGQSIYSYTFLSVTTGHEIRAVFGVYLYSLSVNASGGSVTATPDQATYAYGTIVQLTPSPSVGYEFLDWSGDVSPAHVSDNPLSVRVDSNMTISAMFDTRAFALVVSAQHGTVTRSPNQAGYDSGAVVQITAVPDQGYSFTGWTGDVTTNANPLIVFMSGPRSLTAHFLADSATLGLESGAHGHVSPSGAVRLATLHTQRFVFTPDPGYATDSVLVDGVNIADSTQGYTFVSVTEDHTLRVTFATTAYALHVRQNRGWNIVSLPLDVADAHVSVLYPTAGPNAFQFSGGYVQTSVLASGLGYWMKSSAAIDASLDGAPVIAESVTVVTGWNMIGSIATPLAANLVTSDPPGLVTGQFFGYSTGYVAADTIVPAKGYWVKSSGNGTLYLSYYDSFKPSATRIRIVPSTERPPAPPVAEERVAVPAKFALEQNYPNPFNPTTVIRFSVPQDGTVALKVYDVFGREVATLLNGKLSAGEHTVQWNAAEVSSGTYFYRLTTGSATETKMMVLLK